MSREAEMDRILRGLAGHTPAMIGKEDCRRAAVCIPLISGDGGYEVLFEVRSSLLSRQPGDVCFPGGSLEEEETPEEGAKREIVEELLLREGQVEVLGPADLLWSGSLLTCSFAALLHDYQGSFSRDEVEEVFTVPLSFFLETEPEVYYTWAQVVPEENFPFEKIHGGKSYPWRKRRETVYFYQYQEKVI